MFRSFSASLSILKSTLNWHLSLPPSHVFINTQAIPPPHVFRAANDSSMRYFVLQGLRTGDSFRQTHIVPVYHIIVAETVSSVIPRKTTFDVYTSKVFQASSSKIE